MDKALMKKGKQWVGVLMGIISIIAVATAIVVFIVTRIQDKKNGPEDVSPDPVSIVIEP